MPIISVFLLTAAFFLNSQPQQGQDLQNTNPPSNPNDTQHNSPTGTQQHGSLTASTPAPQTDSSANARIQDSLDDLLNSDLVLNGADVEVTVDDRSITLTGTVESNAQHQRVMELVAQYTRWRQVVDKIQMK